MIDKSKLRIGTGLAGPGAPKGAKKGRYVTIASILDSIQESLGCSYQQALADLLLSSREDYETGDDKETYPKLMMQLANKVIEQARSMPEDTTPDFEAMSDEDLKELAKQKAKQLLEEKWKER
jgi:hypothetical protein